MIAGIVLFLAGTALGSLLTWTMQNEPKPTGPFNITPQQRAQAAQKSDRLRAANMLRNVAQAIIVKHREDPAWTLPDSASELLRTFITENRLGEEFRDNWPGGDNRPVDDPPFFIVGTIEDVEALGPEAVLLYEHPDHHSELGGGSIVYANTHVVELEADAFRRRIEELRVQK